MNAATATHKKQNTKRKLKFVKINSALDHHNVKINLVRIQSVDWPFSFWFPETAKNSCQIEFK